MKKNIGSILFWIWVTVFSIHLLLTDWLQIRYREIFSNYFWLFKNFQWVSYALLPIILLLIKNSFFKKAFIAFVVGLWMWGLMFIFDVVYSPTLLNIDFSQIGEPTMHWLCMFFSIWCVKIAVVFLVIGLFVKHLLPLIRDALSGVLPKAPKR